MSRTAVRAILVGLVLASFFASVPAGAALSQPPDGYGIHVGAFEQLNPRQVNVRVSTEALHAAGRRAHPASRRLRRRRDPGSPVSGALSLPRHEWTGVGLGQFRQRRSRPPPVCRSSSSCPTSGFDGDGGGWFADWFNAGAGGPPMWETFHIDQLVPWIDANLRTIPARSGRAVAGLSQGGFGSLSYAARHPDLFTSAAAFSGACEIDRDPEAIDIATAIIQYTTSVLSGVDEDAIFGPRATQNAQLAGARSGDAGDQPARHGHSAVDRQRRSRPARPGSTRPGSDCDRVDHVRRDAALPRPSGGRQDPARLQLLRRRHAHLSATGHATWRSTWARSCVASTIRPAAEIDQLSVRRRSLGAVGLERCRWIDPERAFSHLRYARRSGFALTGTGSANVQTPSLFQPGARLRVIQRGPVLISKTTLTVGPSGRLQITVPLSDDARPRTTRVSMRVLSNGP